MSRLRPRPPSRRTVIVRHAAATAIACAVVITTGVPGRAALLATLVTEVGGVAVLAPDTGDPVIGEAVSRLRAELHLVGLEAQTIDCDGEGAQDARVCSGERATAPEGETATPSPGLARAGVRQAIIALAREDGVVTIEVIERLLNGSKFFRLVYVPSRDGGDDPAVLAVRGVELLRDLHMDVERSWSIAAAPSGGRRPDPGGAGLPELPAGLQELPAAG